MAATKEWSRSGSFMKKPAEGWLHADSSLSSGDGVYYPVKYIGSIPFERSMRDLNFDQRTDVTREAITRCCEAAGVKAERRRQVNSVVQSCLVAPANPQMLNVKFTVSTTGIALVVIETNEVIAEHLMPNISFATGGDAEDYEFVGYVAKDSTNYRECHVFDCGHLAADIIATIGQSFELRFKSFLEGAPPPVPQNAAPAPRVPPMYNGHALYDAAANPNDDVTYDDLPGGQEVIQQGAMYGEDSYGDPGNGDPTYDVTAGGAGPISSQTLYGEDPTYDTAGSQMGVGSEYNDHAIYDAAESGTALPDYDDTLADEDVPEDQLEMAPPTEERPLHEEQWFFTEVDRQQAEQLLIGEGDFLVRESLSEMGQYILTVLQDGYPKHLLLVDPQGRVRTATQQFSSPSHLINYHFKSRAPIQSRGTRVHLGNPVSNTTDAPQFVDGVLYGDD
eukprot:m.434912 g.434912  ORF g.434912 m.434912 type:complete len:448 (+) comp17784_c0_seq1:130-1473(+)